MISKRKPSPEEKDEGSKIAIVFNGSPLFTGDAGSGESNIRRWIIENNWLDAIVALPDHFHQSPRDKIATERQLLIRALPKVSPHPADVSVSGPSPRR